MSEEQTPSHHTTLITGASYGIGADLARQCAAHGHHLILVARSHHALHELAAELHAMGAPYPVVIAADLTHPSAVDDIEKRVRSENLRITALVNNAGYGLTGPIDELSAAEQIGMIDLNMRALTALTLCFLSDLKSAPATLGHGRILNVASIAAFMPGPYMSIYYASKAFVLSFSQALRAELKPHRVKVSTLCPGLTATQFQRRAGMDPSLGAFITMSSAKVARTAYKGWMANHAIIIPGLVNKIFVTCAWLLPTSLLLRAMRLTQINRRITPTPQT